MEPFSAGQQPCLLSKPDFWGESAHRGWKKSVLRDRAGERRRHGKAPYNRHECPRHTNWPGSVSNGDTV